MEGRPKTFRRASASKVLPVALLSMRPLFVGANRHYSTVCHNAIRWFFLRSGRCEISHRISYTVESNSLLIQWNRRTRPGLACHFQLILLIFY